MSKITDFFNRPILKPMADDTVTTPDETQDALSERDAALARATEVREETQLAEADLETKRKLGLDLETSNKGLEKTNKTLLADREGAEAELSTVRGELAEAKTELQKVKDARDEAQLARDDARTSYDTEKAQFSAWKINAQREHEETQARMADEIGVAKRYKDALVKDAQNAKEALVLANQEKQEAITTTKALNDAKATQIEVIDGLIEDRKEAEAKLEEANEKVDDAQKELAAVLDETATAKSDLAKETAKLDSKKSEVFAQADRNRLLDEREQVLKDRYKEAGLTYPE